MLVARLEGIIDTLVRAEEYKWRQDEVLAGLEHEKFQQTLEELKSQRTDLTGNFTTQLETLKEAFASQKVLIRWLLGSVLALVGIKGLQLLDILPTT